MIRISQIGVLLFSILAVIVLKEKPLEAKPSWGPWPKASNQQRLENASIPNRLFHFYQEHFSSDDGARCPFYPTCSAYANQALTRHGLFYGSLLSLDRLFSEYPGMPNSGLYPIITKHGIHRPYDPVP